MDHRLRTTRQDPSLAELIGRLAEDGHAWIVAEFAVLKAQIESNTHKLITAITLLILAAVIALAGIVVLAHTLVLVLAPYLGAPFAGLATGGLLIVIAIGFLLYARSKISLTGFIPSRLRKTLSSMKVSRS
ncbi:MAG TPA: phage holin family protein [Aestuariivirgaceae bacterium]|jgi:hypothetical protein